ncbi:MAG: hypothetical protein JST55_09745 [Bacteroidetes bacterium]|nr:hypothetical protein [Bacteroidota bacterium]
MDNLINEVYEIIKDYREDEGSQNQITVEGIKVWILQFKEEDREFILSELINILKERYVTKVDAIKFLNAVIEVLTEESIYQTEEEFLNNTVFLDLQEEGKSQKKLLELLQEFLHTKYNYDINNCGSTSKKYFIYLDDVLCTGKTFFDDIYDWSLKEYSSSKSNKLAIIDGSAKLFPIFIFKHTLNYWKKMKQIEIKIGKKFKEMIDTRNAIDIDNDKKNAYSKLQFLYPLETGQANIITDFKDKIVRNCDEYISKQSYKSSVQEEFYRANNTPRTENFFTNLQNRQRFENILLLKGVEILNNANITKNNIRPLGYSLPSTKDFGFGTLCFTWRNVPNNCPLVFWYSGGGFLPLFVKSQTNNFKKSELDEIFGF